MLRYFFEGTFGCENFCHKNLAKYLMGVYNEKKIPDRGIKVRGFGRRRCDETVSCNRYELRGMQRAG